jgi:Arc/MetJ-type ribon-helix-helix transcriptional regulator
MAQKKLPGSHGKGKSPLITFRVPQNLKNWIDRKAKSVGLSRSDYVRTEMERARKQDEKRDGRKTDTTI